MSKLGTALAADSGDDGFQYGQGTLLAWDPTTFRNTVAWRGTVLHDRPVLAGPAALSFAVGQKVALIGKGHGASSWAILGSWVVPGSGAAAAQIQFMQSTLAKQISAEIFAERVFTDVAAGTVSTSSTSYTTLSGGPLIANVEVVSKAIVSVTAGTVVSTTGGVVLFVPAALASFSVSGATTVPANDEHSVYRSAGIVDDGGNGELFVDGRATATSIVPLNPGLHTFTAQYRSTSGSVDFSLRAMTVIAL